MSSLFSRGQCIVEGGLTSSLVRLRQEKNQSVLIVARACVPLELT